MKLPENSQNAEFSTQNNETAKQENENSQVLNVVKQQEIVYSFTKKDENELAKMSEDEKKKYFDEYNKLSFNEKETLDIYGHFSISKEEANFYMEVLEACQEKNAYKILELINKEKKMSLQKIISERNEQLTNPNINEADKDFALKNRDTLQLDLNKLQKEIDFNEKYPTPEQKIKALKHEKDNLPRDKAYGGMVTNSLLGGGLSPDNEIRAAQIEFKLELLENPQKYVLFDLDDKSRENLHYNYAEIIKKIHYENQHFGSTPASKERLRLWENQKQMSANFHNSIEDAINFQKNKLKNSLTRGLNKENSQENSQTKPQSQELKAKAKIASKALSNANQKQAYYGR